MKVIEVIERRREITRFRPEPIVAILGVGYPAIEPAPKKLHPKSAVLHFESYDGAAK